MRSGAGKDLIRGFIIISPLSISFYVVPVMVGFIYSLIYSLPAPLKPDTCLKFRIPGPGLLATLAVKSC